jgi:hypothetical protein
MDSNKTITLTTTSPSGTTSKVSIDISTIKKIIERLEGSRLYIQKDADETLSSLDVIETKEEVQSILISLK